MKNVFKYLSFATLALAILSCQSENIPDCALGDSCEERLPNLSNEDFSGERFRVLTMDNRDELDDYFQIYQVQSPYRYPAGTIVVDTPNRVLYLMEEQGLARRYPIAVGREGYQFEGNALVGRMTTWPLWYPTPDMREANPNLPDFYEGGSDNPLGARAIYLYSGGRDTLYRIHGNNDPRSIGHEASSGCIRMYNEDVIDLYERVEIGSNVVVIGDDNVPDDVEVDHIGTDEERVEEEQLTEWEEFMLNFQRGLPSLGSADAGDEGEDAGEAEGEAEAEVGAVADEA